MATGAQVNGDVPHSAFLDHLLKYPVLSDSVETVKNNRFGQQGIRVTDTVYQRLARPVLPYFARPYGYVSPYVQKADSMGDEALNHVEKRFPIVTKPTNEVYQQTWDTIFFPYHKSLEGRDHVLSVYNDEYKNVGGQDGLNRSARALFGTVLVVTGETVEWAREMWTTKQKEAYARANEQAQLIKEQAKQRSAQASQKAEQIKEKARKSMNNN